MSTTLTIVESSLFCVLYILNNFNDNIYFIEGFVHCRAVVASGGEIFYGSDANAKFTCYSHDIDISHANHEKFEAIGVDACTSYQLNERCQK